MDNNVIINKIWNNNYEIDELEGKRLPGRKKIHISDGYYCKGFAMFVDMRDSSNFTKYNNRRKTLRRLYASFHMLVIENIRNYCRNNGIQTPMIEISGDGIYCVFNCQGNEIKNIFFVVDDILIAIDDLNQKLSDLQLDEISVGIGMVSGDLLVFKQDNSKHILWMGDAVNYSSKLSSKANKEYDYEVIVDAETATLIGETLFEYFNDPDLEIAVAGYINNE